MANYQLYLILAITFGFCMAWGIGANDVSNAMGTSVGSKAITIRQAIVIAAIFECCGAFFAGGEVTNTIKEDIVYPYVFNDNPEILIIGMLSALAAAGSWLIAASLKGWPVSTTHTIVGAIMGFGGFHAGLDAINWYKVTYIVLSWVLSPFLGAIISFILFYSLQETIFSQKDTLPTAKKVMPVYFFLVGFVTSFIAIMGTQKYHHLNTYTAIVLSLVIGLIYITFSKNVIAGMLKKYKHKSVYYGIEKLFGALMIFTACAMAFAHGSNDVANAIGPVAAVIDTATNDSENFHNITLLLGAVGILIGIITYGYKVIATIGSGITRLTPSSGFCVTLATSSTVVVASHIGLPISTTHTLVGGILGVGMARGIAALNLNMIKTIILSWITTLPIGAILAIFYFKVMTVLFI